MSNQVSRPTINGKYSGFDDQKLAEVMHKMRHDYTLWEDIAAEVGLSITWCRHIFNESGLTDIDTGRSNLSTFKRNARIKEIANEHHARGVYISGTAIAAIMTDEGFKKVNRKVVDGVLHRARKHGETVPPLNEAPTAILARLCSRKSGMESLPLDPIPPRTPELLALGRVSWDDISAGQCRYTPNEEAPYFFCGEAVMKPGSAWCKDCYDNRIRRNLKLEPLGQRGRGAQAPATQGRGYAH